MIIFNVIALPIVVITVIIIFIALLLSVYTGCAKKKKTF